MPNPAGRWYFPLTLTGSQISSPTSPLYSKSRCQTILQYQDGFAHIIGLQDSAICRVTSRQLSVQSAATQAELDPPRSGVEAQLRSQVSQHGWFLQH